MDIEQLNIQVDSDIRRADSGLQALTRKIDTLASAMGRIESMNTQSVANSLNTFSHAMQRMSSIKAPDYNRLAKGLDRLGNVNHGNIQSVANALTPFSTSLNLLNNATFDNKNIQNLINSLTRLSNANVGNLQSINLGNLGNQISAFSSQMQNAPQIDKNVIQFTNAISNLARYGQNIPVVNASLSSLGNEMIHFMSAMANAPIVANETTQFAMAIGQLASAGQNTGVTATNLSTLATELSKFMGVMSKAPIVSQNTIQMTQALANLSNAGKTTIRSTNGMRTFFDVLTSGSNKSAKSVKSLAYYFGKLYANFFIIIRLFNLFKKSIDFASDLTEVQNIVDTTFGSMSKKVEEFASTSIQTFGMSELTAKTVAGQFQAMGTAMGISNQQVKQATEYLNGLGKTVNGLSYGYNTVSDNMADMSLNLTKLAADMGSFYNKSYEDVAEQLQSGVMSGNARVLRQYGLDLTQATVQEWALKHGLDANMKSMSQSEKVMLRYQYVMANTGSAQGDFAKTSMTWANSVRMLKQNFQQFGAVIGRMAIQTFKPFIIALNKVILAFTKLAQKVSDSLGVIFGWKYEDGGGGAISDLGDDTEDFADGLDDATDSAKKLKQQLQGLDELNVLTTPKDSDGGGSGSGVSGGGATSDKDGGWVRIPHNFDSELDTLYKLGDAIGNKLQDVMEGIDWNKIYRKASNFGTGLADFLNGLISPELFYDTGRTIANSINTAVIAWKDFWIRLDGVDVGTSIGAGINGFFENLKVEDLAEGMNAFVDTVEDAIGSALKETDWDMILKKVITFWGTLDWDTKLALVGVIVAPKIATALGGWLTPQIASWFAANPLTVGKLAISIGGISAIISGHVKKNGLEEMLGAVATGLGVGLVFGPVPGLIVGAIALTFTIADIHFDYDLPEKIKDTLFGKDAYYTPTVQESWGKQFKNIKNINIMETIFGKNWKKDWDNAWKHLKDNQLKKDIEDLKSKWEENKPTFDFNIEDLSEKFRTKISDWKQKSSTWWNQHKPSFNFDITEMWGTLQSKISTWRTNIVNWWNQHKPSFNFRMGILESWENTINTWKWYIAQWWNQHKPSFNWKVGVLEDWVNTFNTWKWFIAQWWNQHKPSLDFTVNISNIVGSIKDELNKLVWYINTGYIYKWNKSWAGQHWFSLGYLPGFAQGGVTSADIFMANENGVPELIGTMGGKTAIASGTEVTGISNAVYETSNQQVKLLQQQNQLLTQILAKETGISSDDLFNSVRNSARNYQNRTGNPAFGY